MCLIIIKNRKRFSDDPDVGMGRKELYYTLVTKMFKDLKEKSDIMRKQMGNLTEK